MTHRSSTILTAAALSGAFLAGLVAMAAGAGWRPFSAARKGDGLPLAAQAAAGAVFSRDGGRPGYVVLDEALPAHPAWQQLTDLTSEVEREQQGLAVETAASAEISRQAGSASGVTQSLSQTTAAIARTNQEGREATRTALETTYAKRSETERTAVQSDADRQVAERRAILAAKVDEQVGVKRGQLKAALEAKVEQIRREREAKLLSLQLQLGLKDKDPAAAAQSDSLKEQLQQIQSSIDKDIKTAQKDAEDQLAAYARQVEAEASQELKAYAAQVAQDADRKAAEVENSLAQELASRLKDLGATGAAARTVGSGIARDGGVQQPAVRGTGAPTPLQLRRNALQASLVADVRRMAALVGRQRGLSGVRVVATSADRPPGAVDLTAVVAERLANGTGR